ncbi:MAG: T9SS type A sorting domain-containing protein [Bacteroidota bacterium]
MFFRLSGLSVVVWLLSFNLSHAQTADVIHYDSGYSWRGYNGCPSRLCHEYPMPMIDWDSKYAEATLWKSPNGDPYYASSFLNFRMILPTGYNIKDNTKKYPVIIMLHGAGESGRVWTDNFNYQPTDPEYDNNSGQLLNGGNEHMLAVKKAPNAVNAFPGIVVFPQVSYSASWTDASSAQLTQNEDYIVHLIEDYLVPRYHADINRITMHGLSGGAKGTWGFAQKRPDLFAAILLMSGVPYDLAGAEKALLTTPIRIFQGGLDDNPTPGSSQNVVAAFKADGGNPELFLYEDLAHNTWERAYSEPDFFTWIMAHDKRNVYVFDNKTVVCPGIDSVKLGFSANMSSYQWTQDGFELTGAHNRYYYVTEPGSYVVNFKRPNDQQDQSFKIDIGLKAGCARIVGLGDDVIDPGQYKIYPNPAKDKVYISNIQQEEIQDVHLVSSSGQTINVSIQPGSESSAELNTSSLVPGIYLIRINSRSFRFLKE